MGKKVEQAANFVGDTVEAVVKDPLPFIATVALTSVGVPPALASAAVTAAKGGSMEDVVTAGVSTYVGGQVGGAAGSAASNAGASAATANIVASAAGASASTVTAALASGQPIDKALEAGLTAGALSGSTQGVIEAGKYALAPPETGQGIKAVPGKGTELFGDQTKVSGEGFTDKVPTGGGQGLTVDPATVLYTSQFTPSTGSRVRGTEEGGLQPAYTSAGDSSGISPSTPYQEPRTVTEIPEPVISKTTEQLAKPVISGALAELFGLGPKVPGIPSASTAAALSTPTAGVTTGLTGAGGAGEIEGKETGKQRQNVWNEESLRLKDALGV